RRSVDPSVAVACHPFRSESAPQIRKKIPRCTFYSRAPRENAAFAHVGKITNFYAAMVGIRKVRLEMRHQTQLARGQSRRHLARLEALRRRRGVAGELSRADCGGNARAVRSVYRAALGQAANERARAQSAVQRFPEMASAARDPLIRSDRLRTRALRTEERHP